MLLDSDRHRISHMLEAARQALEYSQNRSRSELEADVPLQHLLVRDIEIIGEAAARLSAEFRESHPEIPWHRLVSMRNRLIHAYFDVDLSIIWRTVEGALPDLLNRLEAILKAEGAE